MFYSTLGEPDDIEAKYMGNSPTTTKDTGDLVTAELVARHLELIQATIGRMANNSFLLRGWNVTLAAGLFALAAKDSNSSLALIALFPAFAFWGLDAYYLCHERAYRKLYDEARRPLSDPDRHVEPFSLDAACYRDGRSGWFRALVRPAVMGVHGAVVVAVGLALCLLAC